MFLHEFAYGLHDINGLGKKGLEKLNNLEICSIKDLIEYFPKRYEDRQNVGEFPDLALTRTCEIMTIFTVLEHVKFGSGFKKNIKIIAETEQGEKFEIVLFNRSFLENIFKIGLKFYIYSKFSFNEYSNMWSTASFDSEPFSYNPERFKKIMPVYGLTEGISSKKISSYVKESLMYFSKFGEDDTPKFLREKYALLPLQEALAEIHFPSSLVLLKKARETLIYREFFLLQVFSKRNKKSTFLREKRNLLGDLTEKVIKSLPFSLTNDQDTVIQEIFLDLENEKPMNRLLQGDVGSGKTLVAMLSGLPLINIGLQVAFMAPTDLLARQHYNNIKNILESFNVSVILLTGSLKKQEKNEVLQKIKDGSASFIIGTHSIFQGDVEFKELSYVIIDEQHKFGVEQREALKTKGKNADTLLMSATPIPQSLALTLFDDLDVSFIRTMPKGRIPVTTYLAKHGNEKKVYEFLRKELQNGHQAYFVYPLISSSEKLDLKDASNMHSELQKIFDGYNVGMVHSKLQSDLKEDIMNDFYSKKIDILVATSVIEVGIDCTNATCMVIENAERFGLSTIHQIRGRVGRGDLKSYLFLLYKEPLSEASKFRLKTIKENIDGFRIAEEDLKLRGPGNLFGLEQTGYLKLKIANFIDNKDILIQMKDEVNSFILNKDSIYDKTDKELIEKILKSYLN